MSKIREKLGGWQNRKTLSSPHPTDNNWITLTSVNNLENDLKTKDREDTTLKRVGRVKMQFRSKMDPGRPW